MEFTMQDFTCGVCVMRDPTATLDQRHLELIRDSGPRNMNPGCFILQEAAPLPPPKDPWQTFLFIVLKTLKKAHIK